MTGCDWIEHYMACWVEGGRVGGWLEMLVELEGGGGGCGTGGSQE